MTLWHFELFARAASKEENILKDDKSNDKSYMAGYDIENIENYVQ